MSYGGVQNLILCDLLLNLLSLVTFRLWLVWLHTLPSQQRQRSLLSLYTSHCSDLFKHFLPSQQLQHIISLFARLLIPALQLCVPLAFTLPHLISFPLQCFGQQAVLASVVDQDQVGHDLCCFQLGLRDPILMNCPWVGERASNGLQCHFAFWNNQSARQSQLSLLELPPTWI